MRCEVLDDKYFRRLYILIHNLLNIVTLRPCNKRNFLRPLNHFRTALFSQQPAILEKPFIARKSIRVVLERNQSQAPNASTAKLALVLHSVGSPKHAMTVKPTLQEFTFKSDRNSEL